MYYVLVASCQYVVHICMHVTLLFISRILTLALQPRLPQYHVWLLGALCCTRWPSRLSHSLEPSTSSVSHTDVAPHNCVLTTEPKPCPILMLDCTGSPAKGQKLRWSLIRKWSRLPSAAGLLSCKSAEDAMPSIDNAADGLFDGLLDGLFCERVSKSRMSLTAQSLMKQMASQRLFFNLLLI